MAITKDNHRRAAPHSVRRPADTAWNTDFKDFMVTLTFKVPRIDNIFAEYNQQDDRGGTVVKVLCQKSEGR